MGTIKDGFRSLLDQPFKATNKGSFGSVVLHMIVFNVGDDRIIGRITSHRSVGLIGFDYHDIAVTCHSPLTPGHFSAHKKTAIQNLSNHGGGGGFSVGSTYSNTGAVAHEGRQHFPSAGNRNAPFQCLENFRMGVGYCG
ncbi:hypothetical protein P4C99_10645 [Pontiellaceae bacterium B1224]|nr:hypothetical protein [Pontiellaceae bacterium B1224]